MRVNRLGTRPTWRTIEKLINRADCDAGFRYTER
jgi:hypothetical protein